MLYSDKNTQYFHVLHKIFYNVNWISGLELAYVICKIFIISKATNPANYETSLKSLCWSHYLQVKLYLKINNWLSLLERKIQVPTNLAKEHLRMYHLLSCSFSFVNVELAFKANDCSKKKRIKFMSHFSWKRKP